MSNSKFKQSIFKVLATTAITFGLIGNTFAAADKPVNKRFENGLWVPGYGVVSNETVKSLNLNTEQEKLLSDAKETVKDIHKQRTKAFKNKSNAKKDNQGIIDPHAANEVMQQRQASTEKWLALWDSLDADQKKTVSDAITTHRKSKFKDSRKYKSEYKRDHHKGDRKHHRGSHKQHNNS